MAFNREHGERRILGALAVISKQSEVLLFQDIPKVEVAGAHDPTTLSWWSRTDKHTWGMPGGGRSYQENGRDETLLMTLSSELTEELIGQEKRPYRRLPAPSNPRVIQQPYPNVVAQEKSEIGKPTRIQQFGVTSVHFSLETLSKIARKDIQKAIDEQRAMWMSLESLVDIFNSESPITAKESGLHFRPQVLMAAYIWYLHFSGIPSATFRDTIIPMNKGVIDFVANHAARINGEIRNGSFNADGTLATLEKTDRLFLLGKQRQ